MASFYRRLSHAPSVGRLVPAYVALGLLKHILPLPVLVRWAWNGRVVERNPEAEQRVVTAVSRLRNWLGNDRDCLQSSILLYRELSRLGADPTLEVGFRRHDERLEGHVWVMVDSRTVPEEVNDRPFVPALRFGRAGAVLTPDLPDLLVNGVA
ncbi:MAG: lasso peptide biosynthesis B2 protein, partial [Vicinamibacterales bacterium]